MRPYTDARSEVKTKKRKEKKPDREPRKAKVTIRTAARLYRVDQQPLASSLSARGLH